MNGLDGASAARFVVGLALMGLSVAIRLRVFTVAGLVVRRIVR